VKQPCYEALLVTAWYPQVLGPSGMCCSTASSGPPCNMSVDIPTALSALKKFQAKSEFHELQVFPLLAELQAQPEMLFVLILWAIRHAHPSASTNINSTNTSSTPHIPVELENFMQYVRKGSEQSLYSSTALKHACQNWSSYLSQAPMVTDGRLRTFFRAFWRDKLLSWFERQWYLEGLESCIAILHIAQTIDFTSND
jgi:hypothetical protein